MKRSWTIGIAIVALAACASPEASADSALALPPVDTLEPATDTTADTLTPPPNIRPQPVTKTPTTTVRQDTTGSTRRDSVIRFDTRNPRRRLPSIPDTSKPPR